MIWVSLFIYSNEWTKERKKDEAGQRLNEDEVEEPIITNVLLSVQIDKGLLFYFDKDAFHVGLDNIKSKVFSLSTLINLVEIYKK